MIFVLLDTFIYSISGIYLCTFLFFMHNMSFKRFSLALILLYALGENIYLVVVFAIMYFIDNILFKYINYNLLLALSLFTFFYLILNIIDASYFINLILVIILYYHKYNILGELHEYKKICE